MDSLVNELKQVLKDELNVYNLLFDLTKKKKDLIVQGQIKELDKITQIEQNLILKLGKYENKREDSIERLGNILDIKNEATVSGITDYLSKENKKEIDGLKEDLLSVLGKIKEKNDLNNMLIKDSLDYISFNLNIMTDTSNDSTYSKNAGENKGKQSKNIFDAKV